MSFNEINAVENFIALTPWPLSQMERGDNGLLKRHNTMLSVVSSPFWGRPGGGVNDIEKNSLL